MPRELIIPTPRAFRPLLQNKRFKGAKGGRGGGKSRFFADLLVEEMLSQHIRAACVREVQNSIKDSVKQLIEDSIERFGASGQFKITEREIVGPNDSLVIFRGLQNHTATGLKSLTGFNRAHYEEAQSLSKRSVEIAIPTFRDNAQQWFSWNPEKETDPVDVLFRENEGDPDFVCVTVNYYDNPYFPDELRRDMERDRRRDPDKYQHVWLGEYRKHSEARIFHNWKVEHFDPPQPGEPLYFGADWGFTIDPTVLVCCFTRGRTLFVWREVWQTGCKLDLRGALFDRIDPAWSLLKARDPKWVSIARKYQITADSAEPHTIDYMQRHGFPRMRAAIKGPDSVEAGIQDLGGYDIVVHPDCRHVADELSTYSYKIDKKSGNIIPELADADNHTIDSLRYALENVRHASESSVSELRI